MFITRFVKEAIEFNKLAVGGNPLAEEGAFVSMYARGFVSEQLRLKVLKWVSAQPEIIEYWVGELVENK